VEIGFSFGAPLYDVAVPVLKGCALQPGRPDAGEPPVNNFENNFCHLFQGEDLRLKRQSA
jgi:hypothetical protein